jgi:beta-N-acetylhexosaminidase
VVADRPRRRLAAALLGTLLVSGCRSAAPPEPARLAALTPQLGRLLLVGFDGTAAEGNAELQALLCTHRVGGVILFARNLVDAEQARGLTGWMRERSRACTGRELLVAVDAEGGRVMRLGPDAGYTSTLSAEELGQSNDLVLTELEARRIAGRLRAAGINWNLAPVVDVGVNPANPVIVGRSRSYSPDPELVTAHARAFILGMRAGGILTTLKHFPGHGSSFDDSHLGFVDVTRTADPAIELRPYRTLLAEDLVDSVMTAHLLNRHLDRRLPATLSRRTVEGLLRDVLGFAGVVVSDDLRMAAIEQHYGGGEAAVLALAAGVDMLLIGADQLPDGRSAAAVALEAIRRALGEGRLDVARVEAALARVRALSARLGPESSGAPVTPSPSLRWGAGPAR